MGTKAFMGSNFDRVSNRSFSRMSEYTSFKDQPEDKAVFKNTSELVPQSSTTGNFKPSYKIPVNSGHCGSATNNNNQVNDPSLNSIPESLKSTLNSGNRAKTAVVATGNCILPFHHCHNIIIVINMIWYNLCTLITRIYYANVRLKTISTVNIPDNIYPLSD